MQGLTGSKKEYQACPFNNSPFFSIETEDAFDGDSDFKIWVSGVGEFEIKFHKRLEIKKVGKFLSEKIL